MVFRGSAMQGVDLPAGGYVGKALRASLVRSSAERRSSRQLPENHPREASGLRRNGHSTQSPGEARDASPALPVPFAAEERCGAAEVDDALMIHKTCSLLPAVLLMPPQAPRGRDPQE